MSIQVEPDELGDALRVYRFAYLITVGEAARSHVVAVAPTLSDGELVVAEVGRRSLAHLAVNPAVTLVWPPTESGGHSLIVDGEARLEPPGPDPAAPDRAASDRAAASIRVRVGRAVLHRPASNPAGPSASGCVADCVELPVGPASLSEAKGS